jgi:hypothetical protein
MVSRFIASLGFGKNYTLSPLARGTYFPMKLLFCNPCALLKLCVSCDPYGRRPPLSCKFRKQIASFLSAPFYPSIVPHFFPLVGELKENRMEPKRKQNGN